MFVAAIPFLTDEPKDFYCYDSKDSKTPCNKEQACALG